jgi:hypothetical protein
MVANVVLQAYKLYEQKQRAKLGKMANWSFMLTAKKSTDASLFAETRVPVQRENQENLFVVLWTNRK